MLTIVGIGAEINLIVWMFGLTTLGSVVTTISGLLAAYAYDKAYTMSTDSTASVANQTAASNVMSSIEMEVLRGSVEAWMINRQLSAVAKDWWKTQMWLIAEEEKAKNSQPQVSAMHTQMGRFIDIVAF